MQRHGVFWSRKNYGAENGQQYKQISNNGHGHKREEALGIHGEHAHDYLFIDGKLNRILRELTILE